MKQMLGRWRARAREFLDGLQYRPVLLVLALVFVLSSFYACYYLTLYFVFHK